MKDMIGPGLQIEVESPLKQFISVADITGGAEQIREPHRTAFDFGKRQLDVALALMGCVIHSDQHPSTVGSPPGMSNERIPGTVPIPGRLAGTLLPLSIFHDGLPKNLKQTPIEVLSLLVRGFARRPNEMR